MEAKIQEGKARRKTTRKASLEPFSLSVQITNDEVLTVRGEKFIALDLMYAKMRGYPWDVKNRFRSYVSRGKYRTVIKYGLPFLSITKPLVDEAVTVVPEFTFGE